MLRLQQCRSLINSGNNVNNRNSIFKKRGILSPISCSSKTLNFLSSKNTNRYSSTVTCVTKQIIPREEKNVLLSNRNNRIITLNKKISKFSSITRSEEMPSPSIKRETSSSSKAGVPSQTIVHRIEEIKLLLNQEIYPIGKLPCNEVERIFSSIDPANKSFQSSEVIGIPISKSSSLQERNQYAHYLHRLWNRTYKEYTYDPKLTSSISSITTTPSVLKNIIEYCIQVPNGTQAKKTFEDWLDVYGSNIEHHPVNDDIELVMYAFYNNSKQFHRQLCIKSSKYKKRNNSDGTVDYSGYTANMHLQNMKQMHAFYNNMKSLFKQGNMYIHPFDSYYFMRMLLVSWSHWAQILNHLPSSTTSIISNDDADNNDQSSLQEDSNNNSIVNDMNIQMLKKEAAENAHALLSDLNKIANQQQKNRDNHILNSHLQDYDEDNLSTFQCQCHVISAYIADGSKDALDIAMNLLDNLEDEISSTIKNNIDSSFGIKEWKAVLLIYDQLMRAHSSSNPLLVESLFYRLIQLNERLVVQEQITSLEWKHFRNVIESFYYYKKNDIDVRKKVETLLQDMNDHYVHVIPIKGNQYFFSIDYLLKNSSNKNATQALILELLMRSWLSYYSKIYDKKQKGQKIVSIGTNSLCNSILQMLCQTKQIKQAEDFFAYLKTVPNQILSLNTTSYIPLLTYLSPEKAEMYLREMDQQQQQSSGDSYIRPNRFCYTILMQNYAKKGNVKDSLRIFNEFQKMSPTLDQASNNASSNDPESSSSSSVADYSLDRYAYSSMLNALGSNASVLRNKSTQEYIEYVWNTIPLSQKNDVLYSIMINIYAKISTKESALKALKVLKHMETSYLSNTAVYPRPDNICFTNAIQALCYDEDEDTASFYNKDASTAIRARNGNSNNQRKDIDAAKIAEKLYLKLKHDYKMSNYDKDLKPNVRTLTSLFNVWIKHDHLDQADHFLKHLIRKHMSQKRKRNAATSSSTPSALVLPNVYTFTMVLDAWSKSSNQRNEACERCEEILSLMEDYFDLEDDGFPSLQHYTMTINAWSNSHAQDKALRANKVLQRMKNRWMNDDPYYDYDGDDKSKSKQKRQQSRGNSSGIKATPQETYAYTSLINACATSSKAPKNIQKDALEIAISSMKELRLPTSKQPNHFTYIAYVRAIQFLTKHEGSNADNPRKYNLLKQAFSDCCEDGLLHERVIESFYLSSSRLKKSSSNYSLFDEVTKGHIIPPKEKGQRFIIDYESLDKDWIRNL